MALLSLVLPAWGRMRSALLIIGLGGASLFFGDAMITPAISVLSAVEGVEIVTPLLKPYIVPLAAAILVGLFMIQSRGSASVGRFFGPIMAFWFVLLGAAGAWNLLKYPQVLAALNPTYAISFLAHADGWIAFTVLGSVFLALTGGEALYADMGHFGRKAIRIDWFLFVMPALVLNYFGQGALVLSNPDTAISTLAPRLVRICPATEISDVITSFKTARSFLPSDGRPALLAQPLGVRLNGAKCRLQRRRYDRRGGMRCFFPVKGPGRDPHCFSLHGDRASPSRCYFLRHHPIQFRSISGRHSRRQKNGPSPPQCDACVENCRPELGRQLEWCVPLCHVGKAQQWYVCSVRRRCRSFFLLPVT